jgi:uncharacterized membrane protein YeaQ/YmgE (transglycosylase-associated protein family)
LTFELCYQLYLGGQMTWILVAIIGAIVGTIVSLVVRHLDMPVSLCVGLGVIGALVGAGLNAMIGAEILGAWSFYLSGAVVSVCILAGGILAYSLTSEEKRA